MVVAAQSLTCVQLFVTQAFLSFTISWNLLKLMSTELVMLSNHLFLCCPFLLLPSIFTRIRVFSNESVFLHQVTKVWEIDGETVEQCQTLFWGAPKSLWMVTAAMKLKDTYSLEGKL